MFEAFLLIISLLITFISSLILSIRQLQRSSYKSLLAWYIFIYLIVMNTAVLIFPYIRLPDIFIIQYDQEIVNRIYYGLFLINFIALIFLLFIDPIFSKRRNHIDFIDISSVNIQEIFKNRFKILYVIILFALINLFTSPEIIEAIQNMKGIFEKGDYDYYYKLRSMGFQNYLNPLSLSFYAKLVIFDIIIPIMCLYSLHAWLLTKKNIWLQRWFITFLIWIIISMFTIQKGPILALVLSNIFLMFFVQYEKRKITNILSLLKNIAIYSLPLVITIIGLYTIVGFEGNLLSEVIERLIFEPIYTTYAHFATFPDINPHLSFSSSKVLNAIKSDAQYAIMLEPYQLAAKATTGVIYNANTSMLGNSWAKAGYFGIILDAILFFGVLLFWDIILTKNKKNLVLTPLISLFLGKATYILNLGTNNMLISHGLIIIPLIYILIFFKR